MTKISVDKIIPELCHEKYGLDDVNSLPYHKQITIRLEAEEIMRILRAIKKNHTKSKHI